MPVIVALAGRRVDPSVTHDVRFPPDNTGLVEKRLRDLFRSHNVVALVSSAACGADLIAQRVARSLSLQRVMVLPFPPDVFRERSVCDRPGNWGAEFDALLDDARTGQNEVVEWNAAHNHDDEQTIYEQTNLVILDRAQALAAERNDEVLPVIVWDGKPRGPDDLTAAFGEAARALGLNPLTVSTLF